MKRLFLFVAVAAMSITASATDLWTGEKHISWEEGGIDLAKEQLATTQAGNLVKVHYSSAATNIEFKVMEVWHALPGATFEAWISGAGVYDQYLTETAVNEIKEHGMQIIGGDFTVTKVELLPGKDTQKGGTIWTGYFWMDNWSTHQLAMEGLAIDWSKYKELAIYHEAGRTDYIVNVLSQFDVEGAKVPEAAITKNANEVVVDLSKCDMDAIFNAADEFNRKSLKIQMHKEGGNAFNMTDIVLVPKDGGATAVENTTVSEKAVKTIVDGQIVIIKNGIRYNTLGVEIK